MKVMHIPFCFYPDPVGGTEVYVEALAQYSQKQGMEIVIASPGKENAMYEYESLRVRRFALGNVSSLRDLYGEGDLRSSEEFTRILDEERPDLVHLHAFTRGVSLRLVREMKQRNIPLGFTYHTPTVSCQRGTLLRWGKEVCEGYLDLKVCTKCTLHGLGLSKTKSAILGNLPIFVGKLVDSARLSGGFWTALQMSRLIHLRHLAFRSLMEEADFVVALCQWTKDLLRRNGVSAEKISVIPHGLDLLETDASEESQPKPLKTLLRLVYIGRLHPTKGLDIIIRTLKLLPGCSLELHIYGVTQDGEKDEYFLNLKRMAADDSRIAFFPPVPRKQVLALLKNYDALVVPSRWLETGPLVVLEAFAAGIPVIGSHLGGIAELIEHEVNGLLVTPDSMKAWCETILRVSRDEMLLKRLRGGIRFPRKMDGIAKEMFALYNKVINIR